MEDMLEVLEWVAHVLPASMEAYPAEFISFVIVFLGSADHIRNAHLRARLVDVSDPGLAPAFGIFICAGLEQGDKSRDGLILVHYSMSELLTHA